MADRPLDTSGNKKKRIPHQKKLGGGRRMSKRAERRAKGMSEETAEIVHAAHSEVVIAEPTELSPFSILPAPALVQGRSRALYDSLGLAFLESILRGERQTVRRLVVNKETGDELEKEYEITPSIDDKFRAVDILARNGRLQQTLLIDGEGQAVPEEATRAAWGVMRMLDTPKTA